MRPIFDRVNAQRASCSENLRWCACARRTVVFVVKPLDRPFARICPYMADSFPDAHIGHSTYFACWPLPGRLPRRLQSNYTTPTLLRRDCSFLFLDADEVGLGDLVSRPANCGTGGGCQDSGVHSPEEALGALSSVDDSGGVP
jgi:hypothetical protein